MDALSQICEDLHIGRADCFTVLGHGDWQCRNTSQHLIFYLVVEGQCTLSLHDQTEVPLSAGSLLMLCKGQPHTLSREPRPGSLLPAFTLADHLEAVHNQVLQLGTGDVADCRILCFQCRVDQDMARPLFAAMPAFILIEQQQQRFMNAWVDHAYQFLVLETQTARPGRDTLVNRVLGMVLIECLRHHIEQLSEQSDSWLMAFKDPVLLQVMNAIHRELSRDWRVDELAAIAHMSRSTFAERFTQKIGVPPLTYIWQRRLLVASYMLREAHHNCAFISEKLGFASENTFSQAFKKHYGLTPSMYRKQYHPNE